MSMKIILQSCQNLQQTELWKCSLLFSPHPFYLHIHVSCEVWGSLSQWCCWRFKSSEIIRRVTSYQSAQSYIVKDLNLPTPRQKSSLYRASPAWEANSCSVTQEICCISRNPWIILITPQQKLCSIELVKWQTRKLDILIPEDGTDMLSQNVGNKPTYAAQQTTSVKVTRKKISTLVCPSFCHECSCDSSVCYEYLMLSQFQMFYSYITFFLPDGVTGIFHWHNPSSCTMTLGLTQPLTEMSTRNISWEVKAASAQGWQHYVVTVLKFGSLNLPEPSGPVQTCTGIALPSYYIFSIIFMILSCILFMIHVKKTLFTLHFLLDQPPY